jgi:hypothetical protein
MSKWPDLATLMIMFPLGSKHLIKTGLPVLLLFHLASLMAAIFIASAIEASPQFIAAATGANALLNAVSYNLLSLQGFPHLRTADIFELPARFWVLVYWLLMQTVAFWPVWLLSVVWEGKSRARFWQTRGASPQAQGDLQRIFKLCALVQGGMAGLALGCILHKPFVDYAASTVFGHVPS